MNVLEIFDRLIEEGLDPAGARHLIGRRHNLNEETLRRALDKRLAEREERRDEDEAA